MKIELLVILSLMVFACAAPKKIESVPYDFKRDHRIEIVQVAPDTCHARGIAVVDSTIYTANNNGFVYQKKADKSYVDRLSQNELPELRDIYVLSEDYFIAMQSNEQSVLLLSQGLVESRLPVFRYPTFMDALDINSNGFGVLFADPLDDSLRVAVTKNYGKSWELCYASVLKCVPGEAGFAASGSIVQVINDSTYVAVSGGMQSRFFKTKDYGKSWTASQLQFFKSNASGPFSLHFWDDHNGVLVGGNYLEPNDTLNNCFLTSDGGLTWYKPLQTTSGYKSCVTSFKGMLFACGTNGIDISFDKGKHWEKWRNDNAFAMTVNNDKLYITLQKGKVMIVY